MDNFVRYIKIYYLYLKQSFMLFMAHRFNLFMSAIANFAWTMGQLVAIRFLFTKLPSVQGWTFNDLVLLLAFGQCAFYTAFVLFESNLAKIGNKIIRGELDIKLVKPVSILFQLSFEDVMVAQIIPIFITVTPLLIYGFSGATKMNTINIFWGAVVLILGIIVKYFSDVIVCGVFFFINRTHIYAIYSEFREINRLPPSLFPKWVENVFTFVIPVLFVSYYPLMISKGDFNIVKVIFIEICLLLFMMLSSFIVWRKGLREYSGVG